MNNNPNQNPFGGKSLDYVGGNDPNEKNNKKGTLEERLQEADTERRKAREAAEARERAAEIAREERLKKIAYMQEMPDNTPAGTGKSGTSLSQCYLDKNLHLRKTMFAHIFA